MRLPSWECIYLYIACFSLWEAVFPTLRVYFEFLFLFAYNMSVHCFPLVSFDIYCVVYLFYTPILLHNSLYLPPDLTPFYVLSTTSSPLFFLPSFLPSNIPSFSHYTLSSFPSKYTSFSLTFLLTFSSCPALLLQYSSLPSSPFLYPLSSILLLPHPLYHSLLFSTHPRPPLTQSCSLFPSLFLLFLFTSSLC